MEKKNVIRLNEEQFLGLIKESVKSVLNEKFNHWNSKKLAELIKKHGMPKYSQISQNYFLTQLRDDNIEGISDKPVKGCTTIELGDGTMVVYNTNNNEVARDYNGMWSGMYNDKYIDKVRPNNGFAHARANNHIPSDCYSRKHYKPSTTRGESARNLRTNPYFLSGKDKEYNPDSVWNRKEANRVMNNLRVGKDQYGQENNRF